MYIKTTKADVIALLTARSSFSLLRKQKDIPFTCSIQFLSDLDNLCKSIFHLVVSYNIFFGSVMMGKLVFSISALSPLIAERPNAKKALASSTLSNS
jgi:hypothetical protein